MSASMFYESPNVPIDYFTTASKLNSDSCLKARLTHAQAPLLTKQYASQQPETHPKLHDYVSILKYLCVHSDYYYQELMSLRPFVQGPESILWRPLNDGILRPQDITGT